MGIFALAADERVANVHFTEDTLVVVMASIGQNRMKT